MEPTGSPPRRLGRWRLGALAALAALVMAGMAVPPGAAYADPGTCQVTCPPFPRPPVQQVPCAQIGPIVWHDLSGDSRYVAQGVEFDIVSATRVLDVAYGRFNENRTNQTISGTWTASQSRMVSFTSTFNFSLTVGSPEELRNTINVSTGFQVVQAHTTQIGVNASTDVPPHSIMLGEYGVQSLDVVFNARRAYMRHGRQTCDLTVHINENETAHGPTVNEGWRFTLINI